MNITPKTKIDDLLDKYPFLVRFMAEYNQRFALFEDKYTRAAIGHASTLRRVAAIGGVDLAGFMQALAKHINGATGDSVKASGLTEIDRVKSRERVEAIKRIIKSLSADKDVGAAQKSVMELTGDIEPAELAEAEAELIAEGMPADEVMHLCELHVNALNGLMKKDETKFSAGHPVNTYMEENKEIASLTKLLGYLVKSLEEGAGTASEGKLLSELDEALDRLKGVETHYTRKEHLLFPILERHGVTGPPQVMWNAHDENRALLGKVKEAAAARDLASLKERVPALGRALINMACMENEVLLPIALNTLTRNEWLEIRKGEDEVGYAFASPGDEWLKEVIARDAEQGGKAPAGELVKSGVVDLGCGGLSVGQIMLIFEHLPVDITFVDEHDEVRFFNRAGNRLFARGKEAIGRKVQRCHPQKSLSTVNRILSDFRRGLKDVAEFWIQMGERFVHIRYLAVRDDKGAYRGCLEVSQDATQIRGLQGQKRLLD